MGEKILVAGASGLVGYAVASRLKSEGRAFRTLSRAREGAARLGALTDDVRLGDATSPEAVRGCCDGVGVVVSCVGASVGASHPDRRGYAEVDTVANLNLLEEARRAGVRRFVYLGVHTGDGWRDTAYVQAHEAVVRALAASGIPWAVVRPTGIFGAFRAFLPMARAGLVPLVGDGRAHTNPIHEDDVASALLDAVADPSPSLEVPLGGPEAHTRRDVAELCFAVLGKRPRTLAVPPSVWLVAASAQGLWDRRASEFLRFVVAVGTHECVAPARGARRLEDYLREAVAKGDPGASP